MPFQIHTRDGRVLAVFTVVGCEPDKGICEHRLTEVMVLEGQHHHQAEELEPVDEDWE